MLHICIKIISKLILCKVIHIIHRKQAYVLESSSAVIQNSHFLCRFRDVGDGWAGRAIAHLNFCRSVNPISHILPPPRPPILKQFPTSLRFYSQATALLYLITHMLNNYKLQQNLFSYPVPFCIINESALDIGEFTDKGPTSFSLSIFSSF